MNLYMLFVSRENVAYDSVIEQIFKLKKKQNNLIEAL